MPRPNDPWYFQQQQRMAEMQATFDEKLAAMQAAFDAEMARADTEIANLQGIGQTAGAAIESSSADRADIHDQLDALTARVTALEPPAVAIPPAS